MPSSRRPAKEEAPQFEFSQQAVQVLTKASCSTILAANVMPHLHELLAERVKDWRSAGYPSDAYPCVGEILEFALLPELKTPRFLRWPQTIPQRMTWIFPPSCGGNDRADSPG